MFYGLLIFLHVVISLCLVIMVLLQSSKGAGLAGTFGGSGITGGVFGGRGAAPFLTKATTVFAILFMFTSLSLNYVKPTTESRSVLERTLGGAETGSEPAVINEMPIAPATSGDEQNPGDLDTDIEEKNDTE